MMPPLVNFSFLTGFAVAILLECLATNLINGTVIMWYAGSAVGVASVLIPGTLWIMRGEDKSPTRIGFITMSVLFALFVMLTIEAPVAMVVLAWLSAVAILGLLARLGISSKIGLIGVAIALLLYLVGITVIVAGSGTPGAFAGLAAVGYVVGLGSFYYDARNAQ
jgi:hypothetical protein